MLSEASVDVVVEEVEIKSHILVVKSLLNPGAQSQIYAPKVLRHTSVSPEQMCCPVAHSSISASLLAISL